MKEPKKISELFSKIFFFLYVAPIFCYFALLSALYIPIMYLTSLDSFSKGGLKKLETMQLLNFKGTEDSDSDEELEEDAPKSRIFSKRRAAL